VGVFSLTTLSLSTAGGGVTVVSKKNCALQAVMLSSSH
jgi:hypothetical protein